MNTNFFLLLCVAVIQGSFSFGSFYQHSPMNRKAMLQQDLAVIEALRPAYEVASSLVKSTEPDSVSRVMAGEHGKVESRFYFLLERLKEEYRGIVDVDVCTKRININVLNKSLPVETPPVSTYGSDGYGTIFLPGPDGCMLSSSGRQDKYYRVFQVDSWEYLKNSPQYTLAISHSWIDGSIVGSEN